MLACLKSRALRPSVVYWDVLNRKTKSNYDIFGLTLLSNIFIILHNITN
jgi:hypothetical protein